MATTLPTFLMSNGLNHLIDRGIETGDVAVTADAYDRLVNHFSGNFAPVADRALNILPHDSRTTIPSESIYSLCEIAIHAYQNATKFHETDGAKRFARKAVFLSRLQTDVNLQRDVVRQVSREVN